MQPSSQPSINNTVSYLPHIDGISVISEQNVRAFKIVLPFLFTTHVAVVSDGFVNVVVSTPKVGTNYVLLGGDDLFGGANIDTSQLHSMSPAISYDFSGRSVSNAGDVNGDGYDDLIIGVPYAARCYVLFGTKHGFVNMTEGFTVFGVQSSDLTGWSVSGAGKSKLLFFEFF
jgi:hypothetical protein